MDSKLSAIYGTDDPGLIATLEHVRANRIRVTVTFRLGEEEWEESGYVGRSTGISPIALLVNNRRSMGGFPVHGERMIQIRYANKDKGGVIWTITHYEMSVTWAAYVKWCDSAGVKQSTDGWSSYRAGFLEGRNRGYRTGRQIA